MATKQRKGRRWADKRPRLRLNRRVADCLGYGLLILFLGLWQAAPHGWPTIAGGHPLLLIPAVMATAMFTGPIGGAAAGVGAGVLWSLYANRLFGFDALLLMILGCAAGLLVRLLMRNNPLSALWLTAGGTVIHSLFSWLCMEWLSGRPEAGAVLWHTVLPSTVYTVVLGVPVYGLVRLTAKLLRRYHSN